MLVTMNTQYFHYGTMTFDTIEFTAHALFVSVSIRRPWWTSGNVSGVS